MLTYSASLLNYLFTYTGANMEWVRVMRADGLKQAALTGQVAILHNKKLYFAGGEVIDYTTPIRLVEYRCSLPHNDYRKQLYYENEHMEGKIKFLAFQINQIDNDPKVRAWRELDNSQVKEEELKIEELIAHQKRLRGFIIYNQFSIVDLDHEERLHQIRAVLEQHKYNTFITKPIGTLPVGTEQTIF